MRRFWAAFHRAHDDERGLVLANVVIFGTVLLMMVATMIVVSTSGAIKSAADRNFQNAMAAAYAGLSDYQSKLSNDNGYAVYGNSNAAFSKASGSVFQGDNSNAAFTSSGSTWAPVVGATDEFFRYEVDNSNYSSKGVLRVRVSGKAGGSVRSLVANLKGDGFINYLYFTNYESAQPAVTGSSCTSEYQWAKKSTTCGYVQFAGSDVLNGPVRTNDTFTSCGATFNGSVEDHGAYVNTAPSSSCRATTYNGASPSSVPYLGLPALNSNMSQEARTDIPTTVPRPGCLYTGPTSVVFNSDGTMTVRAPWTKATQIKTSGSKIQSSDDTAKAASLCGSISRLQSATGATIPTLPSNLMYVQDVPSGSTDQNVNAWPTGTYPTGYTNTYCTTKVTVASNGNATLTQNQAYNNGLGYPTTNEWVTGGTVYSNAGATGSGDPSSVYGCTSGDVFTSGTFSGAMTIASSGTIWLTDNLKYKDQNNDILGLVGQNAVEIWNPAKCSSYYQPGTYGTAYCRTAYQTLLNRSGGENLTVNAAIASNAGTFYNQNWDIGSALGTLTVRGSIAQNWRGIVATGGATIATGFSKNYVYDNRLLTTAPPKFLQPVSTSYGVTTQVETQPAYNADGSCITDSSGGCR